MSVEAQPFSPLVAQVMTASINETNAVTNRLIEALTERAEHAEAELDALRWEVTQLISGNTMPTPKAIQRALYPEPDVVALFREDGAV